MAVLVLEKDGLAGSVLSGRVTLRNRRPMWRRHGRALTRSRSGWLAYSAGMSDTKDPVYLDADLLARVDALADEAGVDRDEYVEDGLRRYLAGRDLVALQREVSGRAAVPFEDALELVYAERDAG